MPTIDSRGVPIQYEVVGEGQPIVLVHGYSSSFDGNWRTTGWVDFLTAQGRQVIGLDCRGHGMSGKPRAPAAYAGNQMPDDVVAVLDAIGLDQVDIMGYSMGGWITLNLVSRHSGRFRSAAVGGAGLRTAAADPVRRAAIAAAMETNDPSTIADPVALRMRAFAERRGNDLLALAALQRSERAQVDESALRSLRLPLLAVVGARDEALASARVLVGTVPGAELLVLPGHDHLSAVPDQGYKDAVAAFLKQHALVV
jgi:pimeloyl-ACP methyl ester carboxylesterase